MSKRKTVAARLLEEPRIKAYLAAERARAALADTRAVRVLQLKFSGRIPRPLRAVSGRLLRDPRDVAFRYLRRFVGGQWYRGGSHVARLNLGPGIGFPAFRNDRRRLIAAIVINPANHGLQATL